MENVGKTIVLEMFHMLPSGGGARLAAQNLKILQDRFEWRVNWVENAAEIGVPPGVSSRRYPFSGGRRLEGPRRLFAPWALMGRLRAFRSLCRTIGEGMNRRGEKALVHNSMIIASPPVLDYLEIPSLYFCYEYPRHLYEKDCIHRTGSRLGDLLLAPLERMERREDRISMSNAGRVATFSPYMRDRIRAIYGVESDMVYPGVDSSFFHPDRDQGSGAHFLSVGALWPFKGHEGAIRAVSGLPETRRPPLIIAADRQFPGYRNQLNRLAARSGVSLTILMGISDEHLRDLYRDAIAVLCFQKNEPYGLVPLEAMACGRPVVARASGGLADNVIHGENGLLFRDSRGDATEHLLSLMENPGFARTIGRAGMTFVRSCRNPEHSAERLAASLSS